MHLTTNHTESSQVKSSPPVSCHVSCLRCTSSTRIPASGYFEDKVHHAYYIVYIKSNANIKKWIVLVSAPLKKMFNQKLSF